MSTPQVQKSSADQRIRELIEACRNAAQATFLPGTIRQALPKLADVLCEQHIELTKLRRDLQELREQVHPPCEGCEGCGGLPQVMGANSILFGG